MFKSSSYSPRTTVFMPATALRALKGARNIHKQWRFTISNPCRLRIHVASNLHPDLGPAARSEPVLSLECGAVAQPTA